VDDWGLMFTTLKGPLYTLSLRAPGDREAITNPISTPVYSRGSETIRKGSANFDLEPEFPCVALFLDGTHALILKEKPGGAYTRVGFAMFYQSMSPNESLSSASEVLENATGKVREILVE
jgi:hypothetical protein